MRLLMTHEYTHIVQLDRVISLPEMLTHIFGNLYFLNLFQPVWLTEGLAVYEETQLTGGGRNQSPVSDMVLRMAVLDNNFPPITHAANYKEEWPDGDVPYLFGGALRLLSQGNTGATNWPICRSTIAGAGCRSW